MVSIPACLLTERPPMVSMPLSKSSLPAFLLLAATACLAAGTARAQNWPVKPIRLVHGFIAGGSVDITARLLAAPLTELLGQQVVV